MLADFGVASFVGTPIGWSRASVSRSLADSAASPQHRAPLSPQSAVTVSPWTGAETEAQDTAFAQSQ